MIGIYVLRSFAFAAGAAIVLACTTPAAAACLTGAGNFAAIAQDGGNAQAAIDQTSQASGAACVDQGGDGATASILQIGSAEPNVASIVQTGGADQVAYIGQDGDRNQASIGQSQANGATTLGSGSLLPAGFLARLTGAGPASGYGAVIAQDGSLNNASIQQGSDGAYAEVGQDGDANTAAILQDGLSSGLTGNFASLYQNGSGNLGQLEQIGEANSADLTQTGSNLIGSIAQTGNTNTASLTQTGAGLAYAIVQDGSSTVAGGITLTGVTNVSVTQADVQTIVTAR